jgi:hypothetical protein
MIQLHKPIFNINFHFAMVEIARNSPLVVRHLSWYFNHEWVECEN